MPDKHNPKSAGALDGAKTQTVRIGGPHRCKSAINVSDTNCICGAHIPSPLSRLCRYKMECSGQLGDASNNFVFYAHSATSTQKCTNTFCPTSPFPRILVHPSSAHALALAKCPQLGPPDNQTTTGHLPIVPLAAAYNRPPISMASWNRDA